MITEKHEVKLARKKRLRRAIRTVITGTPEKPRMIIVKSNKYLYTQVIDDVAHRILVTASTLEKDVKAKLKSAKDRNAAKVLGETIAERLKEKKIEKIVFDRNVYRYTGRIKAFADAAREKGIQF